MKKLAICAALVTAMGAVACSQPSDSTIVTDAEDAISEEGIPGSIRVASDSGVVTLSGIVPDMREKSRAENTVEDVDGVERVVNNLRTSAGDAPIADPRLGDVPGRAGQPVPVEPRGEPYDDGARGKPAGDAPADLHEGRQPIDPDQPMNAPDRAEDPIDGQVPPIDR